VAERVRDGRTLVLNADDEEVSRLKRPSVSAASFWTTLKPSRRSFADFTATMSWPSAATRGGQSPREGQRRLHNAAAEV
jgi:hypothetical protein